MWGDIGMDMAIADAVEDVAVIDQYDREVD